MVYWQRAMQSREKEKLNKLFYHVTIIIIALANLGYFVFLALWIGSSESIQRAVESGKQQIDVVISSFKAKS